MRQGCPRPPLLFVCRMTISFQEMHPGPAASGHLFHVLNFDNDESLYAGDTLIVATNTRAMGALCVAVRAAAEHAGGL